LGKVPLLRALELAPAATDAPPTKTTARDRARHRNNHPSLTPSPAVAMFFPEHLLSKSGPLARVWLAANLEKKLSKNQVLQDKIGDDIAVIVRPEVAGGPMALRLSGQLLLGVVRIYSRKARYLLDDCTEALMKIKMVGNLSLAPLYLS
jgi:hypothetical protein